MVRKKTKLFWQLIDSVDSSFQFVSGDACFTSRILSIGADSGDSPFVPTRLVSYLGGPPLRNRPRAYKRPFSDFGPIKSRSNTPNSGSNRANSGSNRANSRSNTPKSKSNRFRNPSKTGFNRDAPAGAATLPTQAAQTAGSRRSPGHPGPATPGNPGGHPPERTHPRSRSRPPEAPGAAEQSPCRPRPAAPASTRKTPYRASTTPPSDSHNPTDRAEHPDKTDRR